MEEISPCGAIKVTCWGKALLVCLRSEHMAWIFVGVSVWWRQSAQTMLQFMGDGLYVSWPQRQLCLRGDSCVANFVT